MSFLMIELSNASMYPLLFCSFISSGMYLLAKPAVDKQLPALVLHLVEEEILEITVYLVQGIKYTVKIVGLHACQPVVIEVGIANSSPLCRMNFSHKVDFPLRRTPITIWARLLDDENCPSSILLHNSDRSCDSSSSFWSEKMVVNLLASINLYFTSVCKGNKSSIINSITSRKTSIRC